MRALSLNPVHAPSPRVVAVAIFAVWLLEACTFDHQPGRVYTNTGQDLGSNDWHEISAGDAKVTFVGANPVKKREAQILRDRYRERVTFHNNAVMIYARSYLGGWVATADADVNIADTMKSDFYKSKAVQFEQERVKSASYYRYVVASSEKFHCFVFNGLFGESGIGDYKQGSPGNKSVQGGVCFSAEYQTAAGVEATMLEMLGRARFEGQSPH